MIDENMIDRLLDMSRLDVPSDEKTKFVKQLNDILGYIEKITSLDTSSIDDRESVFDIKNVFSDDVIEDGLSPSRLRKYTKNYLDGYYAVPKILSK
ncbi:MAG: hypothetical protein A2015_11200 [Spirochaetes bacterium GWF1_31_7]|nr:MAG: hypothetical protein A2Y30_02435 [Spirochaetes bacterium GWE1_32_154]OHD47765.1 MAG: hypothetical protein A2015_11200 [Spirochaetes bacterium GWF1_31_7]OHD50631.1 MAG: hypothetical protein A2Y29_17245 [Spirochaetes bacterium GWE2_31_10]OHD81225.1 MAG: hypothetical protein A2355_02150 [Spirochaetes bacterium RIFOXYB1_FULL_32_8]HBD95618.1 hypothetical protein [Spirochaetia bacterium]